MQIENLTRLMLNDDEVAALYEVCASALEQNILSDFPLAFALAIVETLQESEEDEDVTLEEIEEVTLN